MCVTSGGIRLADTRPYRRWVNAMKYRVKYMSESKELGISLKENPKHGFTLLEIMVVVGIITIIITFAIPAMLSATRSAKETSCIKGLKAIYDATELYLRDYGYSPVQTSKPSGLFLREIDAYLPESYAPVYGQNVIIKGYRLFGWVPDDPSHPTFPGVGEGTSSGTASADRVGYHTWRIVAIPIEPNSGMRTFYLEPNGNVSATLDGPPV